MQVNSSPTVLFFVYNITFYTKKCQVDIKDLDHDMSFSHNCGNSKTTNLPQASWKQRKHLEGTQRPERFYQFSYLSDSSHIIVTFLN